MGKSLGPCFRDEWFFKRPDASFLVNGIDIVGEPQGRHVGFASILDKARLGARASVRGGDFDIFACLSFPVFGECLVVLGVEFARRVIADIEKRDFGLDRECAEERHCERQGEFVFHWSILCALSAGVEIESRP